jgi:hypothetical protein
VRSGSGRLGLILSYQDRLPKTQPSMIDYFLNPYRKVIKNLDENRFVIGFTEQI